VSRMRVKTDTNASAENFRIQLADVEDFVRGAALLGAGGGGDPYIGRLMLERELSRGATLDIVSLDELLDDKLVVSVCVMGAPTVMIEKVPSVLALENALRRLEETLGRRADTLIPLEIGGINSTVPLVLGARMGLPVVNADGMGRAFPELQMVTFGIYGADISPLVVTNERGESVTIKSLSNKTGEHLARSATAQMGGAAHVALYPMTGAQTKRTAVRNTLAVALEMGRAIGHARMRGHRPEEALFDALARLPEPRIGRILFRGKIVDVRRTTSGGFNRGEVLIERSPTDSLRIEFQNENLAAYRNSVPIALTPDIITIIDDDTAEPITAETLKFGQRVQVVGISVPRMMRTPEALRVVGPRAFHIDLDYQPFETISAPERPASNSKAR